jgi:hypothetical protein
MDNNNSILKMNSIKHVYITDVDYDIEVEPYLDDFLFNYYVVIQESSDLPECFSYIIGQMLESGNIKIKSYINIMIILNRKIDIYDFPMDLLSSSSTSLFDEFVVLPLFFCLYLILENI